LCADRKQASGQVKFTQQKGATSVRIQASLQLQAIKATDHRQTDCASGRSVELSPACLEIPVTFLGAVKHVFGAFGDDGRRACL
jgi:hypothetical protein